MIKGCCKEARRYRSVRACLRVAGREGRREGEEEGGRAPEVFQTTFKAYTAPSFLPLPSPSLPIPPSCPSSISRLNTPPCLCRTRKTRPKEPWPITFKNSKSPGTARPLRGKGSRGSSQAGGWAGDRPKNRKKGAKKGGRKPFHRRKKRQGCFPGWAPPPPPPPPPQPPAPFLGF